MQFTHIIIMGNIRPLNLAASGVDIMVSIVLMPSGIVAESLVTLVLVLLKNDCCVLSVRHLSYKLYIDD